MTLSPRTLRNIAADSSLAIILVGLSGPLWYLTTLVMARYYGAQAMGTYFIAWNLVLIITGICRLGLDSGLLRFSAILHAKGQGGGVKRLFWPAIGLMTLVSTGAAAVLILCREWLAVRFGAPYLPMVILFLAPALPVFTISFGFRETIRALGGVKSAVFQKNFLIHLTFAIFLLILAYGGGNLIDKVGMLGLAALLSCLVNLLFLAILYQTWTRRISVSPGEDSFRDLFWYSLPLFVNSILLAFNTVDRLVLGYFTSPQEVAYYEVAARLETIIMLPLVAVNSVIPPLIAQFYEFGNLQSLEMMAQTTARWAYHMALPLTLLLILLAPEILGIFGKDFTKASFALIVLSLGELVNVAAGSVGFILNMTGHQWQVAGLRFVAMIISFTLMVVLAKTHGLNGLACASAIGNVLLNFFLSFAIWRYMKIRSFARGIMVANISALLAVLCFFLTRPWVGSFGAAGFFLLAYLALVAKSIKKEIESGFDFQKKTA